MTTVVIKSVSGSGSKYKAAARNHESYGQTMGEALDALFADIEQTETEDASVLVSDFKPDEFFTEEQQRRLSFLMSKWRAARDTGKEFSDDEQAELESLIDAEMDGSAKRAETLLAAR